MAALETAENPFAEISEQLTRLYAQKDATVETVLARLAPLEARLAERSGGARAGWRRSPRRIRARRSTGCASARGAAWAQGELRAGLAALAARAEARDGEGGALAGIADRLTRLVAEKDAGARRGARPAGAARGAARRARGAACRGRREAARRRGPGGGGADREPQAAADCEPRSSPTGSPGSRRGCRGRGAAARTPAGSAELEAIWRCRGSSRCTGQAPTGRPVTPA